LAFSGKFGDEKKETYASPASTFMNDDHNSILIMVTGEWQIALLLLSNTLLAATVYCTFQGAHTPGTKFKDFSRPIPAMFYQVVLKSILFLASHKNVNSTNSYTAGDDGSAESLVFCKLLYIVQSVELEVSKMNSKCTEFRS